jgi:outer membrane protein assembly factor BamB
MYKTNLLFTLLIVFISLVAYPGRLSADDWPQWRGPTRDDVWKEAGMIDKFAGSQIPIRWRTAIGSGYSGPTVVQGRVYVTDRQVEPVVVERVHCFDWQSGHNLWTFTYECPYKNIGYTAGPRASVSIADGRVYALGAMGHLHCLDAVSHCKPINYRK